MKTIIEILIYAVKCFYDPKGMAQAINTAETVEELDAIVLGKNGSPAHLREQGAAE